MTRLTLRIAPTAVTAEISGSVETVCCPQKMYLPPPLMAVAGFFMLVNWEGVLLPWDEFRGYKVQPKKTSPTNQECLPHKYF